MSKEKSKGEEIIGMFNSTGDVDVEQIKLSARTLVDHIDKVCPNGRRKQHAITCIESAAMYAVKSLFEG